MTYLGVSHSLSFTLYDARAFFVFYSYFALLLYEAYMCNLTDLNIMIDYNCIIESLSAHYILYNCSDRSNTIL